MRTILLLVVALVLAGCASSPSPATTTPVSSTPSNGTASNSTAPATGSGTITVVTTKGTFAFQLDPKDAPETSKHIAALAQRGFYDGIPFHRYVADFVIQGGDPNCKGDGWKNPQTSACGQGGSGQTVPPEFNGKHDYGAVGLARAQDPNSGDSQFYVVIGQNGAHFLDGQYTVFGKVTSGMDIVTQLREGDVMTKVTYAAG